VPGNQNRQHIIENKIVGRYGPLAVCIREGTEIKSDIIGGFGLPKNQHVSFDVVFRRRAKTIPVPPPPPTDGSIAATVARIETKLDKLLKHFT